MDTQPVRFLLVHGSIVLLVGLLAGIPFWVAIIRGQESSVVRAWRVAHTTLITCGLAILVVSLTSPHLVLSAGLRIFLKWVFAASGYSFAFALVVGAGIGRRALTPMPLGINTLLFMGHLIGAAGAILGSCVFLYGLL